MTGPSNTRYFTVAVYFRGKRLATGSASSIQSAEMDAAAAALKGHRGRHSYTLTFIGHTCRFG